MPKNKLLSASCYAEPNHGDVFHMNWKAPAEHKKETLRRLIDDRWKKVVLVQSPKAQGRTMENFDTPIYEVMKQATVKGFLPRSANELLDGKMCKLAESQDSQQDVMHQLIKSSAFTVTVTRFIEQQAKRAADSKVRFRQ